MLTKKSFSTYPADKDATVYREGLNKMIESNTAITINATIAGRNVTRPFRVIVVKDEKVKPEEIVVLLRDGDANEKS